MFWRGMPAPFSKGDARNTTCLTRRVGRPTLNHMVKYEGNALDATFAALADPTRRAILARLAGREASPAPRGRGAGGGRARKEREGGRAAGKTPAPVAGAAARRGGRARTHRRPPGGAVTPPLVGVYRGVAPPKKLVYTWRWEDEP